MADSKLRSLLEAAAEKTERGGLAWQAFDDESFRAAIGTGYVHIQRGSTQTADYDGDLHPATTYSVQISDAQGRVVAEDDATFGFDGCGPFARLFEAARKSALGSDRVIDEMLHSLSSPAK
ncbi:MAG: hypothetical protein C0467_10410 [Planctomycetaceae bacterium]|nr:hypothetical protein [Planctomycetaceae bacterium]